MNHRIIARLDIKGPNLVKGIHLEGLRALGSPEEFAKYYYENGADELFYQDVVASLFERNSLDDIITRTAKRAFIPLTVGGGLRTIEDINRVLRAGADKVSINTAALNNTNFIEQAVKIFGSSTIVIAIEAIKQKDEKYLAYTDNGREYTGVDVLEWAKKVESLGVGEICLTSVDFEGTGLGFDVSLTKMVSEVCSIPVIAHGGAGSAQDVEKIISSGKADAVAIASILHYDYISKNISKHKKQGEGNFEFLKKGSVFKKIIPANLFEIKKHLYNNRIDCRSIDLERV
jgi:imidazole glycerol-phosphate synthase subunit HisF